MQWATLLSVDINTHLKIQLDISKVGLSGSQSHNNSLSDRTSFTWSACIFWGEAFKKNLSTNTVMMRFMFVGAAGAPFCPSNIGISER